MGVPHMAIRPKDQLPAVLVTLPLSDHFHVDALLDAPGDEHSPEGSLGVGWVAETLACGR